MGMTKSEAVLKVTEYCGSRVGKFTLMSEIAAALGLTTAEMLEAAATLAEECEDFLYESCPFRWRVSGDEARIRRGDEWLHMVGFAA